MVVPALGDGRFEPARPGFFLLSVRLRLGKVVCVVSGVVAKRMQGRQRRWGRDGSV